MDVDFSTFEKRFEQLKKLRGWTDAQLAEDLGYTRSWWMKLKKDRRTPKTKVWKALDDAEVRMLDEAGAASQVVKASDRIKQVRHGLQQRQSAKHSLSVYLRAEGERLIAIADQLEAMADDAPITQPLDLSKLDLTK